MTSFPKTDSNPPGNSITVHPPAKINLSLVVFDRRADDFHDIHTVMAAIDLCDDLSIRLSGEKGIRLRCSGSGAPENPENLVYRAALLLGEYSNTTAALDITLHKRIPAGGGLGGASSDGAACLLALNHLWKLGLPIEVLSRLACELGSDVPFFLHGPVAMCSGRGEIVTKLPHRLSKALLLIIPGFSISTAKMYKSYVYDEANCRDQLRRVQYFLKLGDLDGLLAQGINSFTDMAMSTVKALGILRGQLEDIGIKPIYMSGSGSCLFASSDSIEQLSSWEKLVRENNIAEVKVIGFQGQSQIFTEVQHAGI
jgi:4-diphosphocytidyl-2-C-methyl-D-erythritol kinase